MSILDKEMPYCPHCHDNNDPDLAYEINGNTYYYKSKWDMIIDNHFDECPMCIAAKEHRKSTLCVCDLLQNAWEQVEAIIEEQDRAEEKGK
jgi:hypothetical protein